MTALAFNPKHIAKKKKPTHKNPDPLLPFHVRESWRSKSFRTVLPSRDPFRVLYWADTASSSFLLSFFFFFMWFYSSTCRIHYFARASSIKNNKYAEALPQLGTALPLRVIKLLLRSMHQEGKQQYLRGLTQIIWTALSLLLLAMKNSCFRSLL